MSKLQPWESALSVGHQKFLKALGSSENGQNIPEELKRKALREIGFVYQMMQQNELLRNCEPQSIINAVTNIARTSITLNPVMRLAYLIPRKGKCILDFSYMGMISLLKNNGNILKINAYIVFEDEDFKHDIVENIIYHTPRYAKTEAEHNKREVLGVYSVAKLPNGEIDYCFMPNWEVEKVKSSSTGSSHPSSPWNNWKDEMIKKTVIKRHFKTLISVNDSINENLSNMMEIENINNPFDNKLLNSTPNPTKRNSLGSAFIEEEPKEVLEEINQEKINEIVNAKVNESELQVQPEQAEVQTEPKQAVNVQPIQTEPKVTTVQHHEVTVIKSSPKKVVDTPSQATLDKISKNMNPNLEFDIPKKTIEVEAIEQTQASELNANEVLGLDFEDDNAELNFEE